MQDAQAEIVLNHFLGSLSTAPASALLLDYDGTLAPFQIERDHAYPYPGIVPILGNIIQCSRTRVIVVTGRPIRELQTLLRPLSRLEVWGEHGLEHLQSDGTYRQVAIDPGIAANLGQAERWLIETGLRSLAEIKPGGIALHWRGLPDPEREKVQTRTLEGWARLAENPGLKLLNFEGGLELRVTHPDKGDAVATILEDLEPGTQVAFLGDDLTDEDAFRVLDNRGLSVLVRPEYRETRAKVWLKPPHELIDFLERWLSSVSA
jgi:trehalose-phosphatase